MGDVYMVVWHYDRHLVMVVTAAAGQEGVKGSACSVWIRCEVIESIVRCSMLVGYTCYLGGALLG